MPSIVIDLDPILSVAGDPLSAAEFLLTRGAWVIFVYFLWWMGKALWMNHIQNNFLAEKLRPVLLAIDVPKLSLQTPKAVENIFAHLAGAHGSHNRREKYFHGNLQEWFSLEMVSIDGYVQFLVWTWDKYRDLVETAIYAQYPDAQITEVEDYAKAIPKQYPDTEWDAWGTELILVKDQGYPIRTWEQFEHKGIKDEPFKDPLAAMLENLARIGPGEQIWIQILIKPIDQSWQKKAVLLVKKLIGAKVPEQKSALDSVMGTVGAIANPILNEVAGVEFGATTEKKKDEPLSKVLFMSPGERAVVELVEKKASKIGFQTKIRVIYAARKEAFKKAHGAQAIVGAIKQYNTNDANALKPEFKSVGPSSLWLFKDRRNSWRKTKLVRAYQKRSMHVGMPAYVLNTEELASLWHFPTQAVHAPLIMRTDARRAQAPSSLPTTSSSAPSSLPIPDQKSGGPPPQLPVVS
ncbi:hypothetical protein HYV74_02610 [Candidatus Uhrbacteria bacterium]|nr:hypothetical protein [Candidatus Uhrbacteria bacterium]